MRTRNPFCLVLALTLPTALAQTACSQAEPKHPPPLPEPSAAPVEEADENWEVEDEDKAKAPPVDEPSAPAEPQRSSRPALKFNKASKITASIDLGGAELNLGDGATLVFPVEALSQAVAYRFEQRKGTDGPKRIGLNYEFAPAVDSVGEPFILELPLPKWAKEANFAVLHMGPPREGQKRGWRVVPATRIDHEKGIAVLETTSLPEGWIYLTSKAPD